ncbi:Integrase catalytic domain-containing protein [Aphis craccivora]|uniref:Integrase catalytic domain-containing protein n=1 Tax=Aphis craccivora TaxID=307492 RepID=A0A6G0XM18_APHCR|nr:Integrase catalytic domain-containing protein [Aphis craccivora]
MYASHIRIRLWREPHAAREPQFGHPCYIRPNSKSVFPIGLYWGNAKPSDSNDFLIDFYTEIRDLILNGLEVINKSGKLCEIKIILDVFCCLTINQKYFDQLPALLKLKCNPEPRYNYDDYVFDLKQKMHKSHKITRERLINKKIKFEKQYDKKEFSEDLDVKDLILLKDKTQKNKLSPLWEGPFEILEILDTENLVIQRGRKKIIKIK